MEKIEGEWQGRNTTRLYVLCIGWWWLTVSLIVSDFRSLCDFSELTSSDGKRLACWQRGRQEKRGYGEQRTQNWEGKYMYILLIIQYGEYKSIIDMPHAAFFCNSHIKGERKHKTLNKLSLFLHFPLPTPPGELWPLVTLCLSRLCFPARWLWKWLINREMNLRRWEENEMAELTSSFKRWSLRAVSAALRKLGN